MEDVRDVAVAPDGGEVVFVTDRAGVTSILALSTLDGAVRHLADDARRVTVSVDGTEVYFIRGGGDAAELWSVSRRGGEPRRLASLPGAHAIFAARDGIHAVCARERLQAWHIPPGGAPAREGPEHAFLSMPSRDGRWTLVRLQPPSGEGRTRVIPSGAALEDARGLEVTLDRAGWGGDGKVYGIAGGRIMRVDPDTRAVEDVAPATVDLPLSEWRVAPDGKTIYRTIASHHVRRMVIANFGERPRP